MILSIITSTRTRSYHDHHYHHLHITKQSPLKREEAEVREARGLSDRREAFEARCFVSPESKSVLKIAFKNMTLKNSISSEYHYNYHQMSHRCNKIELIEARARYCRELKIEGNPSRGEVGSWQKDSGCLEEEM